MMMNNIIRSLFLCLIISCNSAPTITPKPRAYPKVELPNKQYKDFDLDYCKFTFDIPVYAELSKKTTYFDEKPESECWFDLTYGKLNGNLHCSYYEVKNREHFDKLVGDAFKLVSKHQKKVNYQEDSLIEKEEAKVYGIAFELTGPVASPMQFFLTDSTRHFLRGSLYFDNPVNPDSMDLVHQFVKEDIHKMINTFKWID